MQVYRFHSTPCSYFTSVEGESRLNLFTNFFKIGILAYVSYFLRFGECAGGFISLHFVSFGVSLHKLT